MKFNIFNETGDTHRPHPKAEFVGFTDDNRKQYTIEIGTLEELLQIVRETRTFINLATPYRKGMLWNIEVCDDGVWEDMDDEIRHKVTDDNTETL